MNKVIKNIIGTCLVLLTISVILTACKKEVEPDLVLKVERMNGAAARGFNVFVYANEIDPFLTSPDVLDQGTTDNLGIYSKTFPNTVIVDVLVFRLDSLGDTLASKLVTYKLEEKRQKSKKNFERRTMILNY